MKKVFIDLTLKLFIYFKLCIKIRHLKKTANYIRSKELNSKIKMKRIFDICVSLISLIALFPLFFIIIFLIRLTSKGPAFFKQERMGLNGKPFTMVKFRTMRIHDDSKYVQTVENDKRITFVGKYLRKSSIDELPQLFNILIGDMSIVGPRPVALPLNEKYNAAFKSFYLRHEVKPGLTGLAQIKGFRGGDDLDHIEKRLEFDLKYIKKRTLFLDIKIILLTPINLLTNKDVF